MSIKYGIVYSTFLFILFSCSQQNQFPAKKSEKVDLGKVVLNGSFMSVNKTATIDSLDLKDFGKKQNELHVYKQWFDQQEQLFDLTKMESLWISHKNESNLFNFEGVTSWIEITGFLLEITGDSKYSEELEMIAYQNKASFSESEIIQIENLLIPYIFTKNVDHIHVNLFVNATIKYNHTLNGAVEITQETNYPVSGKIRIKFKMQNKRLIEVFIRIPEWAEGATVTEKGVKYVATPGSYCLIARKWNEGDFVEVNLPKNKMPTTFKVIN